MRKANHLIVVGAVAEKDGKILLVQEKKPQVYGLWNTPAGWLEKDENPMEGAKREVKEETGYDVKINSLLGVYVRSSSHDPDLIINKIVFRASTIGGKLNFDKNEILDVKWFEPSEILNMKDSQLRGIRKEIEDFVDDKNYPVDVVRSV
jgi:ADP-ribose pyrophosphatase YjhB (NUDIX family)